MRIPQDNEWWWIWVVTTVIEFGWMWWIHKSQGRISSDIRANPAEIVVMESIVVNEELDN
tara:strand:+ start:7687 stop:7866 length:180 start_codon:yes stop_codon:yes gene_type:complete